MGMEMKSGSAGDLQQLAYRARQDVGDGTDNTGWKASLNTPWQQDIDTNFRVRFYIERIDSIADYIGYMGVYYSINGGTFTYVDNLDETVSDPVLHVVSSNIAGFIHGTDTIEPSLLGGAPSDYLVTNYGINEGEGSFADTASMTWPGNNGGPAITPGADFEWCFKLDSTRVVIGDVITLRMYANDLSFISTIPGYVHDAILTVAAPVEEGIQIKGGTIQLKGGTMQIK